jgi:glucose/arabinose dehydrogenase
VSPRAPRRAVAAATPLLLLGGLLTACAFGQPEDIEGGGPPILPTPSVTASPDRGGPTPAAVTILAKGLAVPWAIGFLPDGTALVTERSSRRLLRLGPRTGPDGLVVTEVQKINDVAPDGEGGLMGLAVSPTYDKDQLVFLYYTTATDNRVVKLKLGQPPTPVLTGIPRGASVHNGGRIAFGPDGFLYIGTGDGSVANRSQDLRSLGGKILRITADGKPAPGNPFPNSPVYSLGHRNVQGLAWDAEKRLYATEFGQNRWDEINLIQPGKNYGWPVVEGKGTDPKYVNPLVVWTPAEASCSGAAMVGPVLVAACLRGQRLWLIRLTGNGTVLGNPAPALTEEYGRLRAVTVAPDGSLWVGTSNKDRQRETHPDDDRILRLVLSNTGGVSKA